MDIAALPSQDIQKKPCRAGWTKEEDELITRLVKEHGTSSWSMVAEILSKDTQRHRVGKQCRTRWKNQLDPDVNHDPWTEEEVRIVQKSQEELGNRWAEIAKMVPPSPSGARRTDNQCKNLWYATLRKNWRRETKQIRKKAKKLGLKLPAQYSSPAPTPSPMPQQVYSVGGEPILTEKENSPPIQGCGALSGVALTQKQKEIIRMKVQETKQQLDSLEKRRLGGQQPLKHDMHEDSLLLQSLASTSPHGAVGSPYKYPAGPKAASKSTQKSTHLTKAAKPAKAPKAPKTVSPATNPNGHALNTGRWKAAEQQRFVDAMNMYAGSKPMPWAKVAALVATRTVVQCRTHAQKVWDGPSGDRTSSGGGSSSGSKSHGTYPHAGAGAHSHGSMGKKRGREESVTAMAMGEGRGKAARTGMGMRVSPRSLSIAPSPRHGHGRRDPLLSHDEVNVASALSMLLTSPSNCSPAHISASAAASASTGASSTAVPALAPAALVSPPASGTIGTIRSMGATPSPPHPPVGSSNGSFGGLLLSHAAAKPLPLLCTPSPCLTISPSNTSSPAMAHPSAHSSSKIAGGSSSSSGIVGSAQRRMGVGLGVIAGGMDRLAALQHAASPHHHQHVHMAAGSPLHSLKPPLSARKAHGAKTHGGAGRAGASVFSFEDADVVATHKRMNCHGPSSVLLQLAEAAEEL